MTLVEDMRSTNDQTREKVGINKMNKMDENVFAGRGKDLACMQQISWRC